MKTQTLRAAACLTSAFLAGCLCTAIYCVKALTLADRAKPGCVQAYTAKVIDGRPLLLPLTVCAEPATQT